jgi:Protein of unknown function (DUF2877)
VTAASAAVHPVIDGPLRAARLLGVQGGQAVLSVEGLSDVLTVERPGGPQLPCAVEGLLHSAHPGDEGWVGAGELVFGDQEIVPILWWDPRPRVAVVDDANVKLMAESWSQPGGGAMYEAIERAIAAGDPAGLVGLGDGQTPAGDDWLVGRLATLTAFGALTPAAELWTAIQVHLAATTALSATLLRHASVADVPMGVHDLIRFLGGARSLDGDEVRERLEHAGGSSGRWWARGVLDATRELAGR